MDSQVDNTLKAFARSQEQISRELYAESIIVTRLSKLVRKVDPGNIVCQSGQPYAQAEYAVCRQVSGYLHTMAELEDALADNLKALLKEIRQSTAEQPE